MNKQSQVLNKLRTRLLMALAINRAAPLNFPSAMMRLTARRTGERRVRYEFDDDAWCRTPDGEVNLPAFGVLVDMALGGASRMASNSRHRVATSHLKIQFTGLPSVGHLAAKAEHVSLCAATPLELGLSRATITSGRNVIAHADGAFALIGLPPEARRHTYHWDRKLPADLQPLTVESLENHEQKVLDSFEAARDAATPDAPFVEHFWCGIPQRNTGGAGMDVAISAHLGNRSGNVHGGMLVGMAARCAVAAAPAGMRLSSLCSWFLSPGRGATLRVRSSVVHGGRSIAVVRTEVLGDDGKRTLETISQHVVATPAAG